MCEDKAPKWSELDIVGKIFRVLFSFPFFLLSLYCLWDGLT